MKKTILLALLGAFALPVFGQFQTNVPVAISGSSGFNTNPPAAITNTPGFTGNVPQATPQPISIWAGTNTNPNGIYTAGYGSTYRQFDATGTNLVQEWTKLTTTGASNWVVLPRSSVALGGLVTQPVINQLASEACPIIQPGGIVVLGDSLNVWFVTNFPGFGPYATNGAIVCGGNTNANVQGVGWYTNGMTLLFGEAQSFTNESWLMVETNYIQSTSGWKVALDNSCCVSGIPLWALPINGPISMTADQCDYVQQDWRGFNSGVYPASGTNTSSQNLYLPTGVTNILYFTSTNDLYAIINGVTYTNYTGATNYHIFSPGSWGGYSTANTIGGYPGGVVGIYPGSPLTPEDYNNSRFLPPNYQSYLNTQYGYTNNNPLTQIYNESPLVTGFPKAAFVNGWQNDFVSVKATNHVQFVVSNDMTLGALLKSWNYYPVVCADIPLGQPSLYTTYPTLTSGGTNIAMFDAMLAGMTYPNGSFDYFYDWGNTNLLYTSSSFYADGITHPTAQTSAIEATNHATYFRVKAALKIGP